VATRKTAVQVTKKAINEADLILQAKQAEEDSTPQEDLDMFALMKGAMRLTRPYIVGKGLVFHIASLGTEHSLLARRLSMSVNPEHNPKDKNSQPLVIDQHRLNSYHLALAVQNIIYNDKEDPSYPRLDNKVPDDSADVQDYLNDLQSRKEYLEGMLPGIYDRALDHLKELADEVERLSSPESLSNF